MSYQDMPAMVKSFAHAHASAASNAATGLVTGCHFTVPTLQAGKRGRFVEAHWIPDSSQAGSASHYRTLCVYKNLKASTSALVASYKLSATTASVAGQTAQALTNTTTTSVLSATTGDVWSFYNTSVGNGIAVVAGTIQITWRIE